MDFKGGYFGFFPGEASKIAPLKVNKRGYYGEGLF